MFSLGWNIPRDKYRPSPLRVITALCIILCLGIFQLQHETLMHMCSIRGWGLVEKQKKARMGQTTRTIWYHPLWHTHQHLLLCTTLEGRPLYHRYSLSLMNVVMNIRWCFVDMFINLLWHTQHNFEIFKLMCVRINLLVHYYYFPLGHGRENHYAEGEDTEKKKWRVE